MLKPQDVVILLKIAAKVYKPWAQGTIALELGMSASEVNGGIKRLLRSGLARKKGTRVYPVKAAMLEFLQHGIKYVFPIERGEPTRGIATSYAANIFKGILGQGDSIPVWPCAEGQNKGYSVQPLYKSVPHAVSQDAILYDLLAIVDVLRSGNARDSLVAVKTLNKYLDEL